MLKAVTKVCGKLLSQHCVVFQQRLLSFITKPLASEFCLVGGVRQQDPTSCLVRVIDVEPAECSQRKKGFWTLSSADERLSKDVNSKLMLYLALWKSSRMRNRIHESGTKIRVN